mmetsp:Transcript_15423/g.44611  ORF Transcript_15423/g.44611 Transcript_15423/m.44611 type:complete len:95 (-) Transcript_15423:41-325(-)
MLCPLCNLLTVPVSRTGGITEVEGEWDLFDPPARHTTPNFCRCGACWKCYWDMKHVSNMEYWVAQWVDTDWLLRSISSISTSEQLGILESVDFV